MDLFDLSARISIDLSDFDRGLNEASSKFKSFSNGLSKAGSGLKNVLSPAVDGFKAVESVGKKTEKAISTGAKGFAAASTAVAGFGTVAVKSGMQFDSTMSKVSAISGATGDEFQSLRDKALEMGAKTKFSASEAGEAMTYMAMAGWKTGDMLDGIEGIMNLAAASGEDLATTSDIVTDALTALGMTADESGHFADVLAAASSNANTNVGLMGETFKYAAPLAGAMGYTAEDTALAIGLMANAGIKGSQSGTALRSIMTRLAKPTKESSAAMEALGISITNSDGSMKPFGTTISELRTAFSGLSEEQKATYAAMLGGQEAMSGLLAIVNAAPADVEKLTKALDNCNGAAAEMAATMADNLQGDLTLLGSAFESLQIAISDSLTPTLREFAQFGQKAMAGLLEGFQGGGVSGFMSALSGIVTDGVTMLAAKAPEFVSVSLQFVGALAVGMINAAPQVLEAAGQIISMLVVGLDTFLDEHSGEMVEIGLSVIDTVASGFQGAADVISSHIGEFIPLLVQGFATYHETLFTVGLDILGAIGQGIIENKDGIKTIASDTIAHMVVALIENAPMIIEGGIALLEALIGAIVENFPLILAAGGEIVGELIAGISTASPGVQAVIAAMVIPHILNIVDTIGKINGAVGKVVDFVTGGNGIGKILNVGKKLTAGIKALFTLIMAHPVIATITAVIAALVLLWTKCEWFRDGVKAVLEAIGGFFEWAWNSIKGIWEGAVEFFSGIVDGIKGVFTGIGEFLGGLFTAAWELVQGAWGAAVDFFSAIWDGISLVFSVVVDVLGGAFLAAWSAITVVWDAAIGFFGGIADGIYSVFEAVTGFLGDAFSAAWDAVSGAWGAAGDFFAGVWSGIKAAFGHVADWFGGTFRDAWQAVKNVFSAGGAIFDGIKDGILNGLKAVINALISGINKVISIPFNGINAALDIVRGVNILGLTPFSWIGQISIPQIPKLAKGAVIPPNSEFLAVLGDQRKGYNIEAPAALIKQMVTEGIKEAGRANGDTFNFYSPKALDPVSAAREMKKAKQQMALGYV